MGMGPAFDPLTRELSELRRRARMLLRTHGDVLVNSDGTKEGSAKTDRVAVYSREGRLTVRYFTDDPRAHHLMRWKRIYAEDLDGYERCRDRTPELIQLALEHLRRIQVLDDLAEA